jgi:hypothetical protein
MGESEAADVWSIYLRIWRQANADGVHVSYTGLAGLEGGKFYLVPGNKKPARIEVCRPFYETFATPSQGRNAGAPADMPAPDLTIELFVLAHEIGHFESWRGDSARFDLDAASHQRLLAWLADPAAPVLPADGPIILAEENRAWDSARVTLEREGFTDLHALDEHRAKCLRTYVDALTRAGVNVGA